MFNSSVLIGLSEHSAAGGEVELGHPQGSSLSDHEVGHPDTAATSTEDNDLGPSLPIDVRDPLPLSSTSTAASSSEVIEVSVPDASEIPPSKGDDQTNAPTPLSPLGCRPVLEGAMFRDEVPSSSMSGSI